LNKKDVSPSVVTVTMLDKTVNKELPSNYYACLNSVHIESWIIVSVWWSWSCESVATRLLCNKVLIIILLLVHLFVYIWSSCAYTTLQYTVPT